MNRSEILSQLRVQRSQGRKEIKIVHRQNCEIFTEKRYRDAEKVIQKIIIEDTTKNLSARQVLLKRYYERVQFHRKYGCCVPIRSMEETSKKPRLTNGPKAGFNPEHDNGKQ